MATVVFLNVPAYGHVNPSLAVVKELVNRGERVIYYTSTNFKSTIEKMGAEFRTYTTPLDVDHAMAADNAIGLMCTVMEYTLSIAHDLIKELSRINPDYIIHDGLCVWGKVVAHYLNKPAVASIPFMVFQLKNVALTPSVFGMCLQMVGRGLTHLINFFRLNNKIKQQFGIDLQHLLTEGGAYESLNIAYTSKYFQPFHADFNQQFVFVGPAITLRADTQESDLLSYSNLSEEKVLYISLGTVNSVRQNDFYHLCFDAFADAGYQVILAVGKQTNVADLGQAPANFTVKNYVPQLELLPHVDVMINHAGMNSIQECCFFEVPMLCIPQTFEQSMNAVRMEQLHIGKRLQKDQISRATLRNSIDDLMFNSKKYRRELAIVRQSFIQAGGYKKAADSILSWYKKQLTPK